MSLFSSKSSVSNETKVYNTDRRQATAEGGVTVQFEPSSSQGAMLNIETMNDDLAMMMIESNNNNFTRTVDTVENTLALNSQLVGQNQQMLNTLAQNEQPAALDNKALMLAGGALAVLALILWRKK